MGTRTSTEAGRGGNRVFRALADERRRTTLRVLDRIEPANRLQVAMHVVAAERDVPVVDVPREQVKQAALDLRHVHVPVLLDAGLVTREDDELTTTRHPAVADPAWAASTGSSGAEWDAVMDALADERRRVALAALAREGELDRRELAEAVAERRASDDREAEAGRTESVAVALHHVDLPKLEAADLVTYDPAADTVKYEGHPDLEAAWRAAGAGEAPPTRS